MGRSEPTFLRITGTHTDAGTSEETDLQLPVTDSATMWLLVSFHYVRSDGSASNYTPRIGQTAAWTSGDINERLAYSSTAVGTAINDVFATSIPCSVAADGKLYFRPGFDSGSDNDGNYEFWFQKARGS
tara:strand:- start:579 stop:965 length:387 start_codon:yes stop_codon:yes gene_type:complete